MQVIGCLFWWAFGVLFTIIAQKVCAKEEINYSQYLTTEAEVIGTHDYHGSRWMVRFADETGEEVIAADNMLAGSTFRPQKYVLPKRWNTERVYYWKNNHPNTYSISGAPLRYTFRFCNEGFYTLIKEKQKRRRVICWIAAILMFLAGTLILLSGF